MVFIYTLRSQNTLNKYMFEEHFLHLFDTTKVPAKLNQGHCGYVPYFICSLIGWSEQMLCDVKTCALRFILEFLLRNTSVTFY